MESTDPFLLQDDMDAPLSRPLPDLVLPLGLRSLLSFVGSFVLVLEVLYRAWEGGLSRAVHVASKDDQDLSKPNPAIIFSPRVWRSAGWILYSASHLIPSETATDDGLLTDILAPEPCHMLAFISALSLGWMLCFHDNSSNVPRTLPASYYKFLLLANSIFLTVMGGPLFDTDTQLLLLLRVMGATTMMAALKILQNIRRLGDRWERFARPNPHPVVYHAGGPMLILGWSLFLIGTTATTDYDDDMMSASHHDHHHHHEFIPIYLTLRLQLLLAAALGMVPIVMFLDEGAELTTMVSEHMVDSMDGSMRVPYFSS